jgi:hypothetical protein
MSREGAGRQAPSTGFPSSNPVWALGSDGHAYQFIKAQGSWTSYALPGSATVQYLSYSKAVMHVIVTDTTGQSWFFDDSVQDGYSSGGWANTPPSTANSDVLCC